MTQFASTLYPQTNPSNPVLLAYRDYNLDAARAGSWESPATPLEWITYTENAYRVQTLLDVAHVDHAHRVLTRLANITG